jgi:hypothetical protein
VIDVYIYGCLLMIVATVAESGLLIHGYCTLDESGTDDRWDCDLVAMHSYERFFAWTLLRYWIFFNLVSEMPLDLNPFILPFDWWGSSSVDRFTIAELQNKIFNYLTLLLSPFSFYSPFSFS